MVGTIIFLIILVAVVSGLVIGVQKHKAKQSEESEPVVEAPAPEPIVEEKTTTTKPKATKKATTKKTKSKK